MASNYSDGKCQWLVHRTLKLCNITSDAKRLATISQRKKVLPNLNETTYYQRLNANRYLQKRVQIKFVVNLLVIVIGNSLRADIKQYGLRNSTLSALMPSERHLTNIEMLPMVLNHHVGISVIKFK